MNIDNLWDNFLEKIKPRISSLSYDTWFKNTKLVSLDNNIAKILVDSPLQKKSLQETWYQTISDVFSEITNTSFDFEFVFEDEVSKNINIPIENIGVPLNTALKSNLNSKYTFDSFVIGNSNRFAHAASLAVAESPAKAYNPLFIYGGVGLGKTHLMHAIGHYILQNNPNAKVVYVSSEKFTNELINSIKDDKNEEFRTKYRSVDVLLIDDIQFIAGKERTQEEFFHTFNTLHDANKQIILSSDRPPKEIPTLEDRLRSRFEWGLIADIQAPDFETRMAILKKKADVEKLNVPNEVMVYIATKIKSNIRELEGALIRIVAYSSLTNREITVDLATEALKDIISNKQNKNITIDLIQDVISAYFNLRVEDLKSQRRTRNIAYPRQIAMYLSRKLTDMSLPKIGEEFGGRDHTTVIHAYEKISEGLKSDESLQRTIDDITKKITQK